MRYVPNIFKDKKIKKFLNSNFVAKTIVIGIIWFIVLIPIYVYCLARALLDPVGFWQEIALIAVCMIALGWLQGLLTLLGIMSTLEVIDDKM